VTCGAAQALIKMHREPVGHRVVVAGSGPFLLPVAAALVRVGAVVVAVIEAEPFGRRAVSAICRQPSVAAEALRCGWTLAAARSRLRTGYGVARIADRAGGLSVAIAKLDRNGAPRGAQLETLECDAVCLSDGFVPSVDLGQLAGARLQFAPLSRTWAIAANPQTGRTGVDGLWAAGACLNPWAGARLATASGDAAGRDAASALLGRPPEPPPRELSTALTFSRRLAAAFPTKPDWYSRTADDVVVCRCENVDAGAIRRAAKTAADVNAVKHLTRAGMGVCQGRTCQAAVAELTARAGGDTIEAVSHFHARSPVRPITTAVLAGGESDGSGSAASRSRAPTGRH
jgi:NADPH-dependent 2,4-dienoyl-CoA reductase/sulfur reductase-like enzyme